MLTSFLVGLRIDLQAIPLDASIILYQNRDRNGAITQKGDDDWLKSA
jgi:hypothetical protein